MDADLAALASRHVTHVVTRNSHAEDIREFLRRRGVPVASVTVVRKGSSKAAAMLQILPSLAEAPRGDAPRGIFVDDSIGEVCDDAAAALPGLLRVFFRRGAVV